MSNQVSLSSILKDSAIVITGISVLLYIWGLVGATFTMFVRGYPPFLVPELSVQRYMFLGGMIALYFFLPIVVVIFIIFKIFDYFLSGNLTRYLIAFHNRGTVSTILVYLIALAISLLFVMSITNFLSVNSSKNTPQVKSIHLNSSSGITTSYEGLFFLTKKDSTYVFTDKIVPEIGTIYVLNESEIKEILFTTKPH